MINLPLIKYLYTTHFIRISLPIRGDVQQLLYSYNISNNYLKENYHFYLHIGVKSFFTQQKKKDRP